MMTFSVAEQEVVQDGMRVRFGVNSNDTSEVYMTVGTPDQEHFRLTFQRNGALRSIEHIEPEAPKEAVDGGEQGTAGGAEGPVG